ncbi:MAG: TonB family protein [Gammaproteobacteria bacterium]|nr:TonB family protein [Gammaproteobacteria bacterium]MDH5650373.1 TonB family protein [Gammaproteobacteria bacterium]
MSTVVTRLPYRYNVGHKDRIGVTLFFALAVHAIIVLGVSFDLEDLTNPDQVATMEITLVHSKSEEAPEDADYLAQANQQGGGNVQEKIRPSSPFSNPLPTPEQGFAPNSRREMALPKSRDKQQLEVLTVDNSRLRRQSKPEEIPLPEQARTLTAAQLYERSSEMARLSAEINQLKKAYQKEKTHTYLSGANAREYRYANYLDAWRAKVENIGNLNYPSEIKRNAIYGKVLLDVAINPDGSLHSMKILRSSGNRLIDQAAKRIVRMSAPFPPLPEQILKDTDVLHIPREWRFQESGLATASR